MGWFSKNRDDNVLLRWGEDAFTLHQAYSSLFACGGVGSGKTSSAGNWELALLNHPSQPGFVWCCVKADECERALKLIKRAHRLDEVILIGPDEYARLDVMRYELSRKGGSPEMLAQLLDRMGLVASKASSTHDEGIWAQYSVTTLRYAIELLRLAGIEPSVNAVYDVIMSAPGAVLADDKLAAWKQGSVCGSMIARAEQRAKSGQPTPSQRSLLMQVRAFWQHQLPQLGPEFRGSVVGVALNPLSPLIFPPWSTVFGSGVTNVTPEDVVGDGKIILFHPDWSVLVAGTPAQVAQALIVQLVQMACMRRAEGQGRPVVFVRDEVGHVIGGGDWEAKVLSVSRSHRIIHLDAVQDLQTLFTCFGGAEKGKQEAMSWVANHLTKVLFSCSDNETCRTWSALLGMKKELMVNFGGGQHARMSSSVPIKRHRSLN